MNKNINLNTGSLNDKHKIEDIEVSHSDACNDNNIKKHNKEIKQNNDEKYKIIKSYVPNVSGYLAGGSKYKNEYEKYKTEYLALIKKSEEPIP